jgi:hypothetical protein
MNVKYLDLTHFPIPNDQRASPDLTHLRFDHLTPRLMCSAAAVTDSAELFRAVALGAVQRVAQVVERAQLVSLNLAAEVRS